MPGKTNKVTLGKTNKVTLGKRNLAILAGEEDLSEWSDEELLRGQRRDKNGTWVGRKPKVVPLAVHQELNSRRLHKAKEILSDSIVRAAEVLREVMDDPHAENRDKLKAAELIFKTISGRADMVVQVTPHDDAPWLRVLQNSAVEITALPSPAEDDVVDADVVEDG